MVDCVGGGLAEGGAAVVGFGGRFVAAGVGAFEEVAHVFLMDRWEEGRRGVLIDKDGSVDREGGMGGDEYLLFEIIEDVRLFSRPGDICP